MDWECGESGSDEWFECTDIDGDDESYTESGPDVELSIIRSWNIWVAINCPLNEAGEVEVSFLFDPDVLNDEETETPLGRLFCIGDEILPCVLGVPKNILLYEEIVIN